MCDSSQEQRLSCDLVDMLMHRHVLQLLVLCLVVDLFKPTKTLNSKGTKNENIMTENLVQKRNKQRDTSSVTWKE